MVAIIGKSLKSPYISSIYIKLQMQYGGSAPANSLRII